MNKVSRILKNPLVIVLPVIALLLIAWQQYTGAESQINVSRSNILPNGGLDTVNEHGHPVGWEFTPASSTVTATSIVGYESPKLLVLTNSGNASTGNTTLVSPLVAVDNNTAYLYKGFYKSTVPFDLILQSNYADGTKKLAIVKQYSSDRQWTTVSHVFTPEPKVQSVQFIYSFSAKGELQIDNNYLEANPTNVHKPPISARGKNLIPNLHRSDNTSSSPDTWTSFTSGSNKTTSTYITDDGAEYLRSSVNEYKNGEAKWQYPEIQVRGNQTFSFSVNYRSDTEADVVAEYVLDSGKRQFYTLTTLLPAKEWTTFTGQFEAPSNAKSVMVTPTLHQKGVLDTREYTLYDVSKPGAEAWRRPLVSITFDDGWESAYNNGVPLLDQFGYKATFYLNPAAIDTTSFMNSDQVTTLAKHGHELASHGYEHLNLTTLDTQSIDYQLRHAKEYFKQIHNQQTTQLSVPFGGTDSQVSHYARSYYASLRGTESGINTRQNFDPYTLLVLYIGDDTTPTKLANALAEVKASNGWLILVYHRVDTNTQGEPVISPAQFQQQLDTLKKSDLTVKTVSDAMQEINEQP
jgi:peptidoglycan/xylan/chitin deacetylase (PgdA/CDA1 family)